MHLATGGRRGSSDARAIGRWLTVGLLIGLALSAARCKTKRELDAKLDRLVTTLNSYSCEAHPVDLDLVSPQKSRLVAMVAHRWGTLRDPMIVDMGFSPLQHDDHRRGTYSLRSDKGEVKLHVLLKGDLLLDFDLDAPGADKAVQELVEQGYGPYTLGDITLLGADGANRDQFKQGEPVKFRMKVLGLATRGCTGRVVIGLTILGRGSEVLLEKPSYRDKTITVGEKSPPAASFDGSIAGFSPGTYRFQVTATDKVADNTITRSAVVVVTPEGEQDDPEAQR